MISLGVFFSFPNENDFNAQVDDLEKESRKNIAVLNVIKYFNTVFPSQYTGIHTTSLININIKGGLSSQMT